MSEDERILRLENAFATLSELAARSQEVDTKHEARLNTLAESNQLIVELIRRHDERMDEFRERQAESDEARRASEAELHALRAETEHKIAALVDAQIRTEEAHSRGTEELRASTRGLQAGMEELRASARELQAGMEELRAAQADASRKIAALAEAMKQLAESQAHADRRLDGLNGIVRELRNERG